MDSLDIASAETTAILLPLPGWAVPRGTIACEADAAFAAGIALKSLDDLVRAAPAWAGCWRARQALESAAAAVRLSGRNEEQAELMDAVLLTAPGDDPGPAGRIFGAFNKLANRHGGLTTPFLADLAELMGFSFDESLAQSLDQVDAALQSGRAAPFAAADLITAIWSTRPDAEILAFALADWLIAQKLSWVSCVPLLMGQRYGPAFRTPGGRGRLHPGEAGFPAAVCQALVEATRTALRSAGDIARRADRLAAVAPKIRTKGADAVYQKLLEEAAVAGTAPGTELSRWASTRLFDRLESFGAVREFSGRSSFRIYGL
ncbi:MULTISPECIES: DUF1403 family protein [Alphaproteobacteria]|jgi:hypothetical protein|uniref:DUF1403 family protein n=1 Tax=Alphaproteobacteria TaxID=28211 RepID=UPI001E34FE9D|nr:MULTISPECIES: DUF1403 family protein [Alphaproteobacteria]MCH2396434.1 DUF1403 family protein [Oceanibaculum sp.]UES41942.1 DUF1403 family protein [Roseibium aggregatum]